MSGACQTSFRGDHSNPPLYIISSAMNTPNEDERVRVFHTPLMERRVRHPTTIHTSGDPRLPPPNPSSGQNPTPNLTLSEVTPPNQNVHSTATTVLTVSQDKPPVTSPELEALLAALAKQESEKQEPKTL
ncbi:hypothetical protein P9112_010680 [Eukaryota sp. TZLM1-RC]